MKLIDKDKVVAEIEKRINKEIQSCATDTLLGYSQGCVDSMRNVLSFLDTLEVKEVDLVEELDYDDYMTFFKEHPEYNNGDWGFEETWTFGQYCYKLGIKAQKGE